MSIFPNLNNIRPETASKTRAAKGRIRGKTGRGRILVIGTSIPRGQLYNSVADVQKSAYPTRLAEALTGYGVPSLWQSVFGNANQLGNLPTWDPRVTLGVGWTYDGTRQGLGGQILTTSNTGAYQFTPTQNVNVFETYSLFAPGAGTQTVTIGGGAPSSGVSSIVQSGTLAVNKSVSNAAAPGVSAFALTPTSATATRHIGVLAFDSTAYGWDVINAGIPGSFIAEWANTPTGPNTLGVWSPINTLGVTTPDLVVVDILTNSRNNGVALATAMADLLTIVTAIKAAGSDVVIALSPPSDPSSGADAATQLIWAQAALDFAIANNCMFDDWYSRHGAFASWVAAGMMNGTNVHPTIPAYGDYGDHLASLIMSI